jgi:hypothetical protein
LDAIRREAARLYRDARTGKFDPGDASKLGSILALMARLVEGSTLEARITALEKHLAEGDDR